MAGFNPDPAIVKAFPRANESSTDVPIPEWDPEIWRETLRLEYAAYVRYGYSIPDAPGQKASLDMAEPAVTMTA